MKSSPAPEERKLGCSPLAVVLSASARRGGSKASARVACRRNSTQTLEKEVDQLEGHV